MTTASGTPVFGGAFASHDFSEGRVEIRIHPFAYSPENRPVWAVIFDQPKFAASDLQSLIGEEVEVEVGESGVQILAVWKGLEVVLRSKSITVTRVDYEDQDLRRVITCLQAEVQRLSGELRSALEKERRAQSVIAELLRRAEIKAAASSQLQERQAAAIEVLKRLGAHYRD